MSRDKLFVMSQYLAPQHFLSRSAGRLADCKIKSIKNPMIDWFIKQYGVDMSEALIEDPHSYAHFNDFFTRALKPGARDIDSTESALVSPVDGTISQLGDIKNGRIFQAKGQHFTLNELIGGKAELAAPFEGGKFSTIYLSPKDYHRIHMPLRGTLRDMVYIPGKLFSVNPATTEQVPGLFARNERVAAIFDTEIGPVAMVLVGAMIVASIETVWAGLVAPNSRTLYHTQYGQGDGAIALEKGEEMGRFKLGSTVVMLFPKDTVEFADNMIANAGVRMGQHFAKIRS